MVERILMVDDERLVLDGLRRSLKGRFAVTVAEGGEAGLIEQERALKEGKPFPVIVSDMRMPGMNGAQFLTRARAADPDVVALILSGQADLESTINAVNDAALFGFLTKPCPPEALAKALDRALAQHALVMSERELLERTMLGAIDMLTDVMAASSRLAYMRTLRMRALVTAVAKSLGLERDWELVLAARLSQVGCLAIPDTVLARAYSGEQLTHDELALYHGHPAAAAAMIGRIPRLERVAQWIGHLPLTVTAPVPEDAGPSQTALHAVAAFMAFYDEKPETMAAVTALNQTGFYSADVIKAVTAARNKVLNREGVARSIMVSELAEGMELRENVLTQTGMMLVRQGEHVTASLADRIRRFANTVGVGEPIHVIDFRPSH